MLQLQVCQYLLPIDWIFLVLLALHSLLWILKEIRASSSTASLQYVDRWRQVTTQLRLSTFPSISYAVKAVLAFSEALSGYA